MQEQNLPLPIWSRKAEVLRLTGIPRDTLIEWALHGKVEWRKFGSAQQSAIVYRLSDVLEQIEKLNQENTDE